MPEVEVSKILLSLLEIAGTASTARGRSESPAAAAAAAAARARRSRTQCQDLPTGLQMLAGLHYVTRVVPAGSLSNPW